MNTKNIGVSGLNPGTPLNQKEDKFEIDYSRRFLLLDIVPMGAVRMTKSDTWKLNPNHVDERKRQRPAVTRYFDFKNKVSHSCNQFNFQIEGCLEIVFFLPMPESWSEKKKQKFNGFPHKKRPDVDNMLKGFMDALRAEDADIWNVKTEKRYAYKGSILIYF